MAKWTGTIRWNQGREAQVEHAIFNTKRLAFSCAYDQVRYQVQLNQETNGRYSGKFDAKDGKRVWSGGVSGNVLQIADDEIRASGTWDEQGNRFNWTAELGEY